MTKGSVSGVGIGFRRSLADALARTERRVDWLEIIPENFMAKGGSFTRALELISERLPVAAHGVSLSLGGPDPFDDEQMTALKEVLDRIGAPKFSEHLCFATAHGFTTHDLLPLPHNEDAVRYVAARIREAQDRLERRLLIENISTYALMPGSEMDEGAFVTAVIEEADCGLLLDVNNVYVNAFNHGLDPQTLLASMPLASAEQIHLAGHFDRGDLKIDDHGAAVCDEVWALFRTAIAHTGDIPVLIEWDNNLPALDVVLDEADKARAIVAETVATSAAPARAQARG